MMPVILALLASVKIKNDKGLIALAMCLIVVVGGLIVHKDIDPKVGLAFLTGAFALPGFFGRKDAGSDTAPDTVAPPTVATPVPVTLPSGPPSATTVSTLKKAVAVAGAALALAACAGAANAVDKVNDPKDDVSLAACRGRARADVEAGADASAAYADYYGCTHEAGLR